MQVVGTAVPAAPTAGVMHCKYICSNQIFYKESLMQKENKTPLLGTWKLVSFEIRVSNNDVLYPFGEIVKGLLIYTDGYMSGKLMPHNRTDF